MKLDYVVNELTKYENLKQLLKEEFLFSDRLIRKLKNSKQLYINSRAAHINEKLNLHDIITACLDFVETSDNIVPTQMNLNILFEDDGLLIVNKPPFIPVHPSMDHFEDSLSNGVKYYFNSINLKRKIRPVNRLDKNTSGIVVFAKNEYIQECLIKQMKSNIFEKEYIALLEGNLKEISGTINAPIARKDNSIIERQISEDGFASITHYKLIKNYKNFCLVNFLLETGRTHQIRVHTKYIGHSILGDDLYGKKTEIINRQALHAYRIKFIHPITKNIIEIETNLPDDIANIIRNQETNLL